MVEGCSLEIVMVEGCSLEIVMVEGCSLGVFIRNCNGGGVSLEM